jgi:hypothetical protein
MKSIYTFIISIILIILLKLIIDFNIELFSNNDENNDNLKIINDDINYFKKFYKSKKINKLVNNNKLFTNIEKKNKILFITYDNRILQEYLLLHNNNIKEYVKKYNYEYIYHNECLNNVYWCKIHFVLDALKTNKYNYVVLLDSDTIIKNFNIDIGNILNMYSSDIFIGSDNNSIYGLINAGVFAISNSKIGINFLNDCIHYINKDCFNNNGTLKGKWAGICYEQGIMNILINDKYYSNTTILSNNIIFNYNICSNDVFIMHLYGSSSKSRISCFQ